jgi:hypothetical protein
MVNYTESEKILYYQNHPELVRKSYPARKPVVRKFQRAISRAAPKASLRRKSYPARKPVMKRVDKSLDITYMSPFDKFSVPPINNNSAGNFTTINSVSRFNIQTSTTGSIIFIYNPSSRTIHQAGAWSSSTGNLISGITSPSFRFTSDTPTNYKPLRAAIRIKNVTENQQIGGLVRILQSSSPIDITFLASNSFALTSGSSESLLDLVTSNSHSREYTAMTLGTHNCEQIISPATMSAYNSYGDQFSITTGVVAFQEAFESTKSDMAMNSVIMIFEQTSSVNSYSITLCAQNALRYPANSILQEMSKPNSKGDQSQVDKVHEALLKNGSNMIVS